MKLTKEQTTLFGTLKCDIYTDSHGGFYMTREQIGRALEYQTPEDAIYRIHQRHKNRLDPLSVIDRTSSTDGKEYSTILYIARGVYEIIRHSHQPNADLFYDHVSDLLEGLRDGYLKLSFEKETELYKQSRQQGKITRRNETDAIKQFVDYAKAQGSGHAERYYSIYTRLTNGIAVITQRKNANTEQLNYLDLLERTATTCIQVGIAQEKPYKAIYAELKIRLQSINDLLQVKENPVDAPVNTVSKARRLPASPPPALI